MTIKLTDINLDGLSLEALEDLIKQLDQDLGNQEVVLQLIDIVNELHQEARNEEVLERMVEQQSWELDALEWTDLDQIDTLANRYMEEKDSKEFWELCEDFGWSYTETTYDTVRKELAKLVIKERVRKNPLRALTCPISALF